MILATASRFIPFWGSNDVDSSSERDSVTDYERVYDALKMYGPCTARELKRDANLSMQCRSVSARIGDLISDDYVLKIGKRNCSAASHNREVTVYEVDDWVKNSYLERGRGGFSE